MMMDSEGETFVRLIDGRWTRLEKGQLLFSESTGVAVVKPLTGPPLKNEVSDAEYGRLERNLQKLRRESGYQ